MLKVLGFEFVSLFSIGLNQIWSRVSASDCSAHCPLREVYKAAQSTASGGTAAAGPRKARVDPAELPILLAGAQVRAGGSGR